MMEHNGGNQNMAFPSLCRMGCGFYGNSSFDGMCSKCHKDMMKRRQQNTSPTQVSSGRISPAVAAAAASVASVSEVSSSTDSGASSNLIVSSSVASSITRSSVVTSTTPSVDTATPTLPSASTSSDKTHNNKEEEATGGAEVSTDSKDKESDKDKKPKKNRCHTCKKKVGLTGFECRCGGLYCGLHRYSDKHSCTFNYKEMAQEQIRKNNPVVVGQKIMKI